MLAGCGGSAEPEPTLPRKVAERLARLADEVAEKLDAGDDCAAADVAARLQSEVRSQIQARRIPAPFQEPLQGTANDLADRVPVCAPAPPPPPPPPPPPATTTEETTTEATTGEGPPTTEPTTTEETLTEETTVEEPPPPPPTDEDGEGNG